MASTSEEVSDLFRSITEGNLSEDQWKLFKNFQKSCREYVSNDGCQLDETDFDNDDDCAEDYQALVESDHEVNEDQSDTVEVEKSSIAEATEETTYNPRQLHAVELTRKYINGEITFTEFSDLLEKYETDEDVGKTDFRVGEYESAADEDEDDEQEDDIAYVDDKNDQDYSVKPQRKKKPTKKCRVKKTAVFKKEKSSVKDRVNSIKDDEPSTSMISGEKEFQEEVEKQKRRQMYRRNRLPRDLQGLVGEANMRFAQGDYELAIKMCMDVIQLAPSSPEPFQTLGMIYEELGDKEKFLQFSLISAHLSPNDADEWVRLAEMSVECNDLKQALTCYNKAIRCEPNNLEFIWTRCKLYEQLGETKKLIDQLNQILTSLKPEDGELYLRVARGLTKILYDDNQIERATVVMEEAFERHQAFVNSEDINFLLELQMKKKCFDKSIKILCENCGVGLDPGVSTMCSNNVTRFLEEFKNVKSCTVPESLPIDLTVKLIICLIYLDADHLVKKFLGALFQESVEEMGDLYLDVAEAYMDNSMHAEAAVILSTLVGSEKYNLAAVWLHYGECLSIMGRLEEAVHAYHRVVEAVPTHFAARMTLSRLLQQIGQSDDAIEVLQQDEECSDVRLEPQLLLQRSNLLYNLGHWDEFFRVSKLLHSIHIKWPKNEEEMKAYNVCMNPRNQRTFLKEKDLEGPQFLENSISTIELWAHYLKLCNKLFELRRLDELELVTKSSVTSTIFIRDNNITQECDFLRLLACYFNKNNEDAYANIRRQLFKNMNNNCLWNLFNQIITSANDLRHNRFCLRLMFKQRDHIALGILNGNNALVSGSYKHALGEYISVLIVTPNDPFINFCIALIFTHMVCQKFSTMKHPHITQACAFFNRYLQFRGENQESYYNIGRAMHQLNICHAAEYCYLKALEYPPAVDDPAFDLRPEIAFNLSLIYHNSNAPHLAKMYLHKFCVI